MEEYLLNLTDIITKIQNAINEEVKEIEKDIKDIKDKHIESQNYQFKISSSILHPKNKKSQP